MGARSRNVVVAVALVAGLMAATPAAVAQWGPPEIAVQGVLTNLADEPLEGPVTLTFTLYDGPVSDEAVWTETHAAVPLTGGRFDLLLGAQQPLDAPPLFEQVADLWVGIAVDGGAELPRAPLSAVGYALQARHAVYCDEALAPAEDLVCDACIGSDEIADAGVAFVDLGPNGCTAGQVMKRDEANQAWVCAADNDTAYQAGWGILVEESTVAVDKTALNQAYVEEDQEDAVSMEMIQVGAVTDAKITDVSWNKLTAVPEGFADGVDDGLLVELDPGVGVLENGRWCTSDGVSVHCTADQPVLAEDDPQVGQLAGGKWCSSDGSAVTCLEDPPTLVETDPQVGEMAADAVPRFDGAVLVAGSLTDDGGTVTNSAALDQNGAADFADDVAVHGDAQLHGAVDIHGELDLHDQKVRNVAGPAAGTDAANKAYVDSQVTGLVTPAVQATRRKYTVVLALKNDSHCPSGYTVEDVSSLKGPDNWLFININSHGLFMGGMNSKSYGQEYLYAGFNANNGPTKVCHRTYTSSSGNPHVSVIMPEGGNQATCPANYHYLPASATRGNNNWGYMMSNHSGLYIGYQDTWARNSHDYNDHSGYQWRNYTSHVGTLCFRVMGVDEDPATAAGVFPVYLGVKNDTDCPAGWNVRTTSVLDSSNGYTYLQMNDNASVIGGRNDWGHGGNNYMQVNFHYSHVNFVCWNYFARNGQPYHHLRTPHTGACAQGYLSFNADSLKGWNSNGYIAATGHGLYMGGLNGWGMHDYSEGYIQHNFTSNVNNKVCLKLDGVQ